MSQKRRKIIIAGGRDFDDVGFLNRSVNLCLEEYEKPEIVSGGARGADIMGEAYAISCSLDIKRFSAEWSKYGKSAGYIRNAQMAEYADTLIAFWDGKSKGTKHMIDLALKHGLDTHVFKYKCKKC